MSETHTVYKVVRKDFRGILMSAVAGKLSRVVYPLGEWAEATLWMGDIGYHLLVFDSLKNAIDFSWLVGEIIFECVAEEQVELPPMLKAITPTASISTAQWPKGTMMFKKVKLVKAVLEWQVSKRE